MKLCICNPNLRQMKYVCPNVLDFPPGSCPNGWTLMVIVVNTEHYFPLKIWYWVIPSGTFCHLSTLLYMGSVGIGNGMPSTLLSLLTFKILKVIPLMLNFRFSYQQLSKCSQVNETKICCGILFYPTSGVFFTLGSCKWSKGKLQYNGPFGNNHYWMHFDFTPLGILFFGLLDYFGNIVPLSCFKVTQQWFIFNRGKVYNLQHAVSHNGCGCFHSRLYEHTRKTYNYNRNVCNHCCGICISWLQFCPKMLHNLQK